MKELSGRPGILDRGDRKAIEDFFSKEGQVLLPLLEPLEQTEGAIDEVIDVVGRMTIETLLNLSAEEVAGPKSQGRASERDVYWYGRQQGEVVLSDRKVKVRKPRLRQRGVGSGGEVKIPVYERLREGSIAEHVLRLMMHGVSTRSYQDVLREMAETTGVSKSAISREWLEASAEQLETLQSRSLEDLDLLVVYVDGLVFGDHHVLAAVGVDVEGEKQVLGITRGSSENHQVAKDLLRNLVERGLDPRRPRLFVIDGAKALRKAILELFGSDTPIQRCRTHKLRNVEERLPKEERKQTKNAMRAAWRLDEKEGKAKLEKLADWLEHQDHGDAAASLREGMHETFTVNRLGLPPALRRCLATTNIIENPNGGVRRRTRRVTRWRDSTMILRWTAASFLDCEAGFRRIMGYRDLWILRAKLDELAETRAAEKTTAERTKNLDLESEAA